MIIIDFCFLYFFVILMFNNILFYVIVFKLNFYLIYNPLMYLIDYRSIFSYAVTVFVLQFFVLLMINVILFYVIVFKLNFYLIYNHLMYIIDYRWFFISCYNFPFTYNLNILWFILFSFTLFTKKCAKIPQSCFNIVYILWFWLILLIF